MNRFSKDLASIELTLTGIMDVHSCFYETLSIIIIILMANWYILLILPFMFGYLLYIYKLTIGSYREMHRVTSVAKSPILTHLSESIQGNSTIRAF
jgi:ABC-type multidrug transport system fused ATPase/permease subunit